MSTEQMREEFEAWLISTGESADSQNGIYLSPIANIGWGAWQASRASLSVELPEPFQLANSHSGIAYYYASEVDKAIRAAGITVKE